MTEAREPDGSEVQERAAGGVVWRPAAGGVEIVLVHRPRHADWSLPKGKLDDGETWLDAAVREVAEETGLAVEVGEPLGDVTYEVERHGVARTKVVRYWALRATGGAFVPNDEVDELRWVSLDAATEQVSYDLDRDVVDRFRRLGPGILDGVRDGDPVRPLKGRCGGGTGR